MTGEEGRVGGILFNALTFLGQTGADQLRRSGRQIAIMRQGLVERKGWISEAQFLRALNFCMLLPGPEAQQLATYIGWRLHGTPGGVAAGSLFVPPSVLIILALSWLGACALLWFLPVGLLVLGQGSAGVLVREALFFTKAAFVIFGGACAVLNYIADFAVNQSWLSPGRCSSVWAWPNQPPAPWSWSPSSWAFWAAGTRPRPIRG